MKSSAAYVSKPNKKLRHTRNNQPKKKKKNQVNYKKEGGEKKSTHSKKNAETGAKKKKKKKKKRHRKEKKISWRGGDKNGTPFVSTLQPLLMTETRGKGNVCIGGPGQVGGLSVMLCSSCTRGAWSTSRRDSEGEAENERGREGTELNSRKRDTSCQQSCKVDTWGCQEKKKKKGQGGGKKLDRCTKPPVE